MRAIAFAILTLAFVLDSKASHDFSAVCSLLAFVSTLTCIVMGV